MEKLVKNNRHFGIVVSNLEKSLKFYQNLLGLKILKKMNESGSILDSILNLENVNVNTVKMSAGNETLIELLEYKQPISGSNSKNVNSLGASHVAFTVYDLEKTYKIMISEGIKFNSPPQTSSDGNVKVTFCYDPDGTPIELVEDLK